MKKFSRILALALSLVMVLGILTACSNDAGSSSAPASGSTSTAGSASTPAAGGGDVAVDEWDFTMLSVMTGPVSFAGTVAAWGYEYCAELINADGGIRGVPIKTTVRDTAFDTAQAVSEMSAVVDNALVVFGPMDAPGADAAGQVASDAKVPVVMAATTETVREKYAPYTSSYMTDSEKGAADAAVMWAEANPDIKKVVMFYIPSDNASNSEYELSKAALAEVDVEIVGTVEVETGQLDLGPAVVQALGYEADGYYVCLRTEEFVRAVSELRNRGVDDGSKILGGFSAISDNLFDLADGVLEDVYIWNKIDPNYDSPEWKAFVEAFEADNGTKPTNNTGANFFEALMLVKTAIEELELTGDPAKLQEERDALAEWLYNTDEYDFIQGPFKIVNGEKVAAPHFFQIKGDEYVRVDV